MTIATGAYDRVAALRDGRIRPEGIELNHLALKVENIFWRMLRHREFDASELSFGGYVVRRGRGEDDLVALPIFPSRFFRHSSIFVNRDAGIGRPEDLRGRRVGVPEYQMTAAVWVRGILQDDFEVRPEEITWVQGGLEQPGRLPAEPVEPAGVRLEWAGDRSLAAMVASGELDALVTARTPSTYQANGAGSVLRLFPEPWREEQDYYRRTGIFPIMHTFAVRREILDAHPWVASTLLAAFSEAKRLAVEDLSQTSALPLTLPFLLQHDHETRQLMGDDFWPYGVEENRVTLETFVRYMHEQGLIAEPMPIESLFAESTLDAPRI